MLIITPLAKTFLAVVYRQYSQWSLQNPTTGPYPKSAKFIPAFQTLFRKYPLILCFT